MYSHSSHPVRRAPFLCVAAAFVSWTFFGLAADSRAEEFVWNPTNLYNGTHPVSPNPWSTEWVPGPDGSQSIQVTITKGAGYYGFIAIPKERFGNGIDFTAEITFRVATPTVLPKTFYMFARNSKSMTYDLWQRWVGEPGPARTITFPMQLRPIEGGKWTFYVGCEGTGSIIIDKLVIRPGRTLTVREPAPAGQEKPAGSAPKLPLATGAGEISVDLPTGGEPTVLSAEGLLIADGDAPVSKEQAQLNHEALQKLIKDARQTPGNKTILIPKGVYRFAGKNPLLLEDVKDLTIDGQNSEFIFQNLNKVACFLITNSNRLVLKNLNLDWNWSYKPIASLGKLLTLSEDQKVAEFEFPDLDDAGIKLTADSPWMAIFSFNPETLYTDKEADPAYNPLAGNKPTLVVQGNRITATFEKPIALQPGQNYAIRHLYYDQNAFKLGSSQNITFDKITIYSMPGMGWINSGETGRLRYRDCRIVRREGSHNPLTAAADGIHCGESTGNIIIENCQFTGLGDDAINLHDNSWQGGLTYGENDKQLVFANCPKHRLRIEPGNVIRFYKPDLSPAGIELTVSSAKSEGKPDGYSPTATTTVEFTTPVPKNLSYLSAAINTRFLTKNVRINDNKFRQTFGRGILFAGHDATIENNVFQDCSTPIQVQVDIVATHWGEGHGTTNLVIRNNLFENCSFRGHWENAIIYAGGRFPWGPTDYPLFNTFLVENNRFINPAGPAMFLNFAKNVIVRNNTIELITPPRTITPYSGAILLNNSSDVNVENDTWKNSSQQPVTSGVIFDSTRSRNIFTSGLRKGE